MAAEIIIAGVSATIQAIDFWLTHRDKLGARRVFDAAYPKINSDSELKKEARALEALVPNDVLEIMVSRIEKCWTRYKTILGEDDNYLPQEVDEATVAVRRCICRELQRIYDLNGAIPPGILTSWWTRYCLMVREVEQGTSANS